jgi:phage tail P2-like protein
LSLKVHSVLPDNRSSLERALELALSQQLYQVEHLYPQLLDAQKAPLSVVPYLALDKQVSEWSSEDSEQEKRTTADHQWRVFRLSGTMAGIRLALEGLNGETEIQRWHEYGGEPYHMRIRVWVTSAPDAGMVARVSSRIDEAKSERDVYSLGVGVKQRGLLHVAGAVQMAPTLIIGPWVPPVIQASCQLSTGGAAIAAIKVIAK